MQQNGPYPRIGNGFENGVGLRPQETSRSGCGVRISSETDTTDRQPRVQVVLRAAKPDAVDTGEEKKARKEIFMPFLRALGVQEIVRDIIEIQSLKPEHKLLKK